MPSTIWWGTNDCPYGTVAYMHTKIKETVNNKIQEVQLHPPLTVQWVKFCFVPKFVNILSSNPNTWYRVVVGNS
jgi:hypothetical protein